MRSFFVSILLVFLNHFSYAAFVPDTLVHTPHDFVLMRDLQPGQHILSYDEHNRSLVSGSIQDSHSYQITHACKIICDDSTSFITVPEQRLMLYHSHTWIEVQDLVPGDRLLCRDANFVTVSEVTLLDGEISLCEVAVIPHHTLLVAKRGIIAHNFVIATIPPLASSIWASIATAGVIGAAITSFFAKDSGDNSDSYDEGYNYTYTYSPPPPKKPNDEDEFKKKHPHGRYEDVGYHRNHQSGRKSPRPINGQEALDNSFDIPGKERTRIGFSHGQFVVLNETVEGVYHGHVRTWGELRVFMQNILRDKGIVTKAGKFIK